MPKLPLPARLAGVALVVAFLILSILYSVVNPAFESPDEIGHFGFIQHLVTTRSLPVLRLGEPGEAHQPPLYYALAAVAALPADFADGTGWFRPNPNFMWAGNGGSDFNAGQHSTAETFPFSGLALALHLARGLSLLMGLGTVLLTFVIGSRVFPERPQVALLAAALVAFVPQFLFVSGSVNNDNLAVFLATLAFLQMVRLLEDPQRGGQWLLLGIIVAAGILTKMSGFVIGLLAVMLLIVCAIRQRSVKLFGTGLLGLGIPAVLLAGWWFVRNQFLYGDPLAWGLYREVFAANLRKGPLNGTDLPLFLSTQFRSFLGLFGWMNVPAPVWFYRGAGVLAVLGLVGLAVYPFARRRRSPLSPLQRDALAGTVIAVVVQELYILGTIVRCDASCYQGRYLFPAIAPLMLLLAFGLLGLVPQRAAPWVTAGVSLALVAAALYMPLRVIVPAYATAPQPKWSVWLLPHKSGATFGDQIRLAGYAARVEPGGGAVKLKLYWEALRKPDFNYSAFAHLLDAGGQVVAQQDRAPGEDRGYPPQAWLPEDIVIDEHTLPVPPGGAGKPYKLRVGLYNWQNGQQLPVSQGGQPAGTFVLLDFPGS